MSNGSAAAEPCHKANGYRRSSAHQERPIATGLAVPQGDPAQGSMDGCPHRANLMVTEPLAAVTD